MPLEQQNQNESTPEIQNDVDILENAVNQSGTYTFENENFSENVGNELNSDNELNQIIEKGGKEKEQKQIKNKENDTEKLRNSLKEKWPYLEETINNLNTQEIINLTTLIDVGIDINAYNIKEAKNIQLNKNQIKNLDKIINNIGIKPIYYGDIDKLKDIRLNHPDTEYLKDLKNVIYIYPDIINNLLDENNIISNKQIKNLESIKKAGINFSRKVMNEIKDIELTPKEIYYIGKITKGIGVDIYFYEWMDQESIINKIKKIKKIELDGNDINHILELQQKTGIKLDTYDLEYIEEIKNTQIDNEQQIKKIEKLKNDLGISITMHDINKIKDIKIDEKRFENMEKLIKVIKNNININEIEKLTTINEEKISNLIKLKDILGDEFDKINYLDLLNLNTKQIENLKIIKEDLNIEITTWYIKDLVDIELNLDKIKRVEKTGIIINESNLKAINELNNDELEILEIDSSNLYNQDYNYEEAEEESHHSITEGRIIENIQKITQNKIKENKKINMKEIIKMVRVDLITLPKEERLKIITGINYIITKFNTIREYIDFENGPYKSPKELLCTIVGITDENIKNKITDKIKIEQYGTGLIFKIKDNKSYNLIYNPENPSEGKRTGGFFMENSEISELRGTLSVIRYQGKNSSTQTIIHEGQHNRYNYLNQDYEEDDIEGDEVNEKGNKIEDLIVAKNEVIAYLTKFKINGIPKFINKYLEIYMIKRTLTEENGLYQYNKNAVTELLTYAKDLIFLTDKKSNNITIDNVIAMLTATPAKERKNLHDNIMTAIENKKNNPNGEIDFWRNGSETKDAELTKLKNCDNINEFKKILNDPRYSHIPRGEDNKGGIEISAIIDKIIEGDIELINGIPEEIRQIVEELIK